jgi:phosphatidylglycerophosphatase A
MVRTLVPRIMKKEKTRNNFTLSGNVQHVIATVGFTGYFPYAPGSFCSIIAFLLVKVFDPSNLSLFLLILMCIVIGTISAHNTEKILGKDSGHIVVDEFFGYLVAVLFIPRTTGYLFAALILFRIFDILKTPPAGAIEKRVPGGAGIMLDDLVAGIYANVCLQIWKHFLAN